MFHIIHQIHKIRRGIGRARRSQFSGLVFWSRVGVPPDFNTLIHHAYIYIYVCVCVCLNCRFASSFSSIAIHDSTPDLSSAFKVYGAIGSSIGNRGIDGTLQKLYTLHYARPSLFLYPYTFNSTFALCLQDQMYSQYACPLETFAFTTITHPIKQEEFPQ